jgi:hypothetical protein
MSAMETTPMEPQHFALKRWVKTLQLSSSVMLLVFGSVNISQGGSNTLLGIAFIAFGLYSLAQSMFAGVVATEEGLYVRYDIRKPKFHPWENINYATSGRPMMLRLHEGKVGRIPPYIDDMDELRSMVDDTVGPPPPK